MDHVNNGWSDRRGPLRSMISRCSCRVTRSNKSNSGDRNEIIRWLFSTQHSRAYFRLWSGHRRQRRRLSNAVLSVPPFVTTVYTLPHTQVIGL